MYSIELQTVFYEYQNKNYKIKTQFCQPGPSAPRGGQKFFLWNSASISSNLKLDAKYIKKRKLKENKDDNIHK